jgi:hypothetical protein
MRLSFLPPESPMPVVRIIGQLPEGVRDLPQQLRDRGFDVETASDAANCAPETPELTLEECSIEEALSRALALAEGDDVSILVSPGVIVPAPVFDATATEIYPTPDSTIESSETAGLNSAECEPQTLACDEETPNEQPLPASEITAPVHDNVPSVAAEPIEARPQPQEPEPVYFASDARAELPLDIEAITAAEASHQEEESPTVDETDIFAHEEYGALPVDAAELRDTPEALEIEPHDEPAPVADTAWAEPEPVALQSAVDDDSDWPIWQVAGEDEQAPPSAVETQPTQSPILTEDIAALHSLGTRFLAAARVNRILLDDRLFTRIATLTAAMAILLLLVGLRAHRLSPLPAGILHGSSQAVQPAPFQRPAAAPIPTTASEVVPAEATEPGTPHVTAASAHTRVLRPSKPAPASSHPSASHDDGFIARDTVVRYHQGPSPRQIAKTQSGIKYYTDLKSK